MKNFGNTVKWILSIVSFLFSLIVLCKCFPRLIEIPNETGFDYIGLIVGILALLVTMLIGWQIYNALSLEQKVSNIKKEYDGLKDKSEALARQIFGQLYLDLGPERFSKNIIILNATEDVQLIIKLGIKYAIEYSHRYS